MNDKLKTPSKLLPLQGQGRACPIIIKNGQIWTFNININNSENFLPERFQ
jgi:hypothetical protein